MGRDGKREVGGRKEGKRRTEGGSVNYNGKELSVESITLSFKTGIDRRYGYGMNANTQMMLRYK